MGRRKRSILAVASIAAVGLAACGGFSTSGPHSTRVPTTHSVVFTFGVAGTRGKVVQTQHDGPTPIAGIIGTVVRIATSNSTTYALDVVGKRVGVGNRQ